MQCPLCHSRHIGILNTGRFFCADCAVEIQVKQETMFIYHCDEQGELELLREINRESQEGYPSFSAFFRPQS